MTPQLETLEQEELEQVEVTGVVTVCVLPHVLPPLALGCALQRCPPGDCAPCEIAVGSLVSPHWLGHQFCPTSLDPFPYSGWQLEWGVSPNASGVVP